MLSKGNKETKLHQPDAHLVPRGARGPRISEETDPAKRPDSPTLPFGLPGRQPRARPGPGPVLPGGELHYGSRAIVHLPYKAAAAAFISSFAGRTTIGPCSRILSSCGCAVSSDEPCGEQPLGVPDLDVLGLDVSVRKQRLVLLLEMCT